jgi:hypothetical protein
MKLRQLFRRHSATRANVVVACILFALTSRAQDIQIARIAHFSHCLSENFPCGDANHNGRPEVYGTSYYPESLVAYEWQSGDSFNRIAGRAQVHGVWDFGDGDGDGLMEVIGQPQGGTAVIWESPTPDSIPCDSVWGVSHEGSGNYVYPRFIDLDQDGHKELAMSDGCIWLYENTGDSQYAFVCVLSDSPPAVVGYYGDFDVGDLDCDSLMDLVTGSYQNYVTVFEATGNDNEYRMAARCTISTSVNFSVAVSNDMDRNGWPEFIVLGKDHPVGDESGQPPPSDVPGKVMVFEATSQGHYHEVWEEAVEVAFLGWPNISSGDIDGDHVDEFGVGTGGSCLLYKCNGPGFYSQIWANHNCNAFVKLYDVNCDGRAEIIFDEGDSCSIYEDTTGLVGVAEFSRLRPPLQVNVQPTIARLGAPVMFSGMPDGSAIAIRSLDGRLVRRTQGVRQSIWSWNLRNQSGNLVPAGTYFAVVRSKGKTTSLKLCLVK